MLPSNKGELGPSCVRISTDVLAPNGARRFIIKGYGRDEERILVKMLTVRATRMRPEDWRPDPTVSILHTCDLCDDRVEVYDVSADVFHHILWGT